MKITRNDFHKNLYKYSDYIKSCCLRVKIVNTGMINFSDECDSEDGIFMYINFSAYKQKLPNIDLSNMALKAVNAACNTEFEFED